MGLKIDVRVQRLSDYPVSISTVKHGNCPSEYGQIRENVGLLRCWITEVPQYSLSNNIDVAYVLGYVCKSSVNQLIASALYVCRSLSGLCGRNVQLID